MKIQIPNQVKILLDQLEGCGYKAYIVGGCVRDSILARTPNDWDICTSATPHQMLKVFQDFKVVETGWKHGTITVILENKHYEITTLRVDGDYSDNRRPDYVKFTKDIIEDLSRRDFTINAMAYNDREGMIDPFGGVNDLAGGIIKCVGVADERFQEDGLRILRAIRFATQLNFTLDKETYISICNNNHLLENISAERIREEFNKILLTKTPSSGLILLLDVGILEIIIPELMDSVNFDQHNPHHTKNVFDHTLCVLDNIESKLELRLAALLHDIGKPNTFKLDDEGIGHFYGHHKVSAIMCREIMSRLRYSNKEIEYVSALIDHHMIWYEKINATIAKRFINKIGKDKLEDFFKLLIADRMATKPSYDLEDIYKLKLECEKVLSEQQPLSIKDLEVNGYHLMEIGIPQGQEVGKMLNSLLKVVLEYPSMNNKEKLLKLAREERSRQK